MLVFRKKALARAREEICDYNDYIRLHTENQVFARLQFVVM